MIALGSDHGGYLYKEELKKHLDAKGIEYIDFGTDSTASCDYPVYAEKVCKEVLEGEADKGILVCGTGIGMSIAANKFKGIRAACCSESYSARLTRLHNDANVLCLGARVVGEGLAWELAECFVTTPFEGGKHARRVGLIHDIENKQ